jgi:fibro-slime domain-containing protein
VLFAAVIVSPVQGDDLSKEQLPIFEADNKVQITFTVDQFWSLYEEALEKNRIFNPSSAELPFETDEAKLEFYKKYPESTQWHLLSIATSEGFVDLDAYTSSSALRLVPEGISAAYIVMNALESQLHIIVSSNDNTIFNVHIDNSDEPIMASVKKYEEHIATIVSNPVSTSDASKNDHDDEPDVNSSEPNGDFGEKDDEGDSESIEVDPIISEEPIETADISEEPDGLIENPEDASISPAASEEPSEDIDEVLDEESEGYIEQPGENSVLDIVETPVVSEPDEVASEQSELAVENTPPPFYETESAAISPSEPAYAETEEDDSGDSGDLISKAISHLFQANTVYGAEITSGSGIEIPQDSKDEFSDAENEPEIIEVFVELATTEEIEVDVTASEGVDLGGSDTGEGSGLMRAEAALLAAAVTVLAATLPDPDIYEEDEHAGKITDVTYFDVDFFNYIGTINGSSPYATEYEGFNKTETPALGIPQSQYFRFNAGQGLQNAAGNVRMGIAQPELDENGDFHTIFHTYQNGLLFPTDVGDRTQAMQRYYANDNTGIEDDPSTEIDESKTLLSEVYPDYRMPFEKNGNSYIFSTEQNNAIVGSNARHIHVAPSGQVVDVNGDGEIDDSDRGSNGEYILDKNINLYEGSQPNLAGIPGFPAVGFFPFSGDKSNEDEKFNFGFKLTVPFIMPDGRRISPSEDMVFNFLGDDDLWVYIDGKLALDLGGIHDKQQGSINFTTGLITIDNSSGAVNANGDLIQGSNTGRVYWYLYREEDKESIPPGMNTVKNIGLDPVEQQYHTMNVFYLDRHPVGANCIISFNIPDYVTNKVKLIKYADPYTDNNEEFIFDVYSTSVAPNGITVPQSNPTPIPEPGAVEIPGGSITPSPDQNPGREPPSENIEVNEITVKHQVVSLSKNEFQYFTLAFDEIKTDYWYKFVEREVPPDRYNTIFLGDNIATGAYDSVYPIETPWIHYNREDNRPYTVTFSNSKKKIEINVKKLLVGDLDPDNKEFTFTAHITSDRMFKLVDPKPPVGGQALISATDLTIPENPSAGDLAWDEPQYIDYTFNLKKDQDLNLAFIVDDPLQGIYYEIRETGVTNAPISDYITTAESIANGSVAGNLAEGYAYNLDNIIFKNTYAPNEVKLYKVTGNSLDKGVGAVFSAEDMTGVTDQSAGTPVSLYYVYTINVLDAPADATGDIFKLVPSEGTPEGDYQSLEEAGIIIEEITPPDDYDCWTVFEVKTPLPLITLQIQGDGINTYATAYSNDDDSKNNLFVLSPEYCNVYLDNRNHDIPLTLYITSQGADVTMTAIGWERGTDRQLRIIGDFTSGGADGDAYSFVYKGNGGIGSLRPLNGVYNSVRVLYQNTWNINPNGIHGFVLADPYDGNWKFVYGSSRADQLGFFTLGDESRTQQGRIEMLPKTVIDSSGATQTDQGLLPGHLYSIKELSVNTDFYDELDFIPKFRTTDSESFALFWADESTSNTKDYYISPDGKSIVINNASKGNSRGSITVKKAIDKAWYPHGNPIFTFKLEQFNTGDSKMETPIKTMYGHIEFRSTDDAANPHEYVFANLSVGYQYRVTELKTLRYEPAQSSPLTETANPENPANGSSPTDGVFVFDAFNYHGEILFANEKVYDAKYSHTSILKNHFAILAPSPSVTPPYVPPEPIIHTVTFHAADSYAGTQKEIVKYVIDGGYVKIDDFPPGFHGESASSIIWDTKYTGENPRKFDAAQTRLEYYPIDDNYDVYPYTNTDSYDITFKRYDSSRGGWYESLLMEDIIRGGQFDLPIGDHDGAYYIGWYTDETLENHVTFYSFNGRATYTVWGNATLYAGERAYLTYNYIYPNERGESTTGQTTRTVTEDVLIGKPVNLPMTVTSNTAGEHGNVVRQILERAPSNWQYWLPTFTITESYGWWSTTYSLSQVVGWYSVPPIHQQGTLGGYFPQAATKYDNGDVSLKPTGDTTIYADWD